MAFTYQIIKQEIETGIIERGLLNVILIEKSIFDTNTNTVVNNVVDNGDNIIIGDDNIIITVGN